MRMSVLSIGRTEVVKSLAWRAPPATGARDFAWLILFYMLIAVLLTLALSAYGILPLRMNQTILGALGPDTVPVRVRDNFDRNDGIDHQALKAFRQDPRFAGAVLVPQTEVELGLAPLLLQGYRERKQDTFDKDRDIWKRKTMPAVAIPIKSPLWDWALARNSLQDTVVEPFQMVAIANLGAFEEQFNYALYRQHVLSMQDSTPLTRFLPEKTQIRDLTHVVFKVTERTAHDRTSTRMQPVRILWIEGLPLPESVALVFPLSTVELLNLAAFRGTVALLPEGEGRPVGRVKSITLENIDQMEEGELTDAKSLFMKLAACLGAQQNREATPRLVTRSHKLAIRTTKSGKDGLALRTADVTHCAQLAGLPDSFPGKPALDGNLLTTPTPNFGSDYSYLEPGLIEAPCSMLGDRDRILASAIEAKAATLICPEDAGADARGSIVMDRYDNATIYLPGDHDIGTKVREILDWHAPTVKGEDEPVFRLDDAYFKSLERFELLRTILESLAVPIGLLLAILAAILCLVKQYSAFAHRKPQYGFLALCGCSGRQLTLMAMVQSGFCAILGGLVGAGLSWLLLKGLNMALWHGDPQLQAFRALGFDEPDLLVIPGWKVMTLVPLALMVIAALLAFVAMWWLRVAFAKVPMDVFRLRN